MMTTAPTTVLVRILGRVSVARRTIFAIVATMIRRIVRGGARTITTFTNLCRRTSTRRNGIGIEMNGFGGWWWL